MMILLAKVVHYFYELCMAVVVITTAQLHSTKPESRRVGDSRW